MLAATSTEPLEADIDSGTALEFRTEEYEHYGSDLATSSDRAISASLSRASSPVGLRRR